MGLLHKLGLLEEVPENVEKQVEKEPENVKEQIENKPKFVFSPPTTSVSPGQIVGEIDQKIYENLSEAIEKNNLPGNDFLEFMQSLDNLKEMTVDERTKFNMVFTTLKSAAGGFSKDTLLKSIQHYINVVNSEKEIFVQEMNGATESLVNANLSEADRLVSEVSKRMEQIQKLNEEINSLNEKITSLKSVADESEYKIAKKKADFDVTSNQLAKLLEDYVVKINQHIQ